MKSFLLGVVVGATGMGLYTGNIKVSVLGNEIELPKRQETAPADESPFRVPGES